MYFIHQQVSEVQTFPLPLGVILSRFTQKVKLVLLPNQCSNGRVTLQVSLGLGLLETYSLGMAAAIYGV